MTINLSAPPQSVSSTVMRTALFGHTACGQRRPDFDGSAIKPFPQKFQCRDHHSHGSVTWVTEDSFMTIQRPIERHEHEDTVLVFQMNTVI